MGSIPVEPEKGRCPALSCAKNQGSGVPAVTFFNPETDQLVLQEQSKYYAYLSRSGLTGLVILGTNAETLLLTREERAALLATARNAVGPDYPIMAGVGGHSTKQVLEYIADAYEAGANYALVLPAAYFGKTNYALGYHEVLRRGGGRVTFADCHLQLSRCLQRH